MSNKLVTVKISLQLEGFHYWENAPESVAFLRSNHRHLFHFILEKQVKHQDRDVEIILFKRQVENYLKHKYGREYSGDLDYNIYLEFGPKSCEMLADELIDQFECSLVEVNEDGENGAVVRLLPTSVVNIAHNTGDIKS